jgi:hypothetical protein
VIERRIVQRYGSTKPRLRFDRVALRVVAELKKALHDAVPQRKTLLVTISAPIRVPSKTVLAIVVELRARLKPSSKTLDLRKEIYENQIRVRLVVSNANRQTKVLGFVLNAGPEPDALLELAESLLGSNPEAR